MQFERITVFTRDEYREGQEPYAFEWRGKRFEVAGILDRWYEGHLDPTRMPLRYFKVTTTMGQTYILRYHELFRAWGVLVSERLSSAHQDRDE